MLTTHSAGNILTFHLRQSQTPRDKEPDGEQDSEGML